MTEFETQVIEQIKAFNATIATTFFGTAPVSTSAPVVQSKSAYMFFDWLDVWFKEFKAPTLKDGGYDLIRTINKHVKAHIADAPLGMIDGVMIQKALNNIESSRMKQITYGIYKQCFEQAEKLEYIAVNPMRKLKRPKHSYEQGRALTLDEQKLFLYESKKSYLKYLFRFYLLTGCRKSEALGLRWEDITDTQLFIRGTKTDNALRHLPLFDKLNKLLGNIPKTSKYVFAYGSDAVQYEFNKVRNRLPFKDFTLHDLRHTFATRCIESGVDMLTVQKWLGHADYATTANIYSHVTTEFEKEQIQLFNKNAITLKSDT